MSRVKCLWNFSVTSLHVSKRRNTSINSEQPMFARESTRYKRTSISLPSIQKRLHNICIERACLTEIFRTSETGAQFIDKCFARWKGEYYSETVVFLGNRELVRSNSLWFSEIFTAKVYSTNPMLLSRLFTSFRIQPVYNTCRPLAALHRYSSSAYLSSRGYAISSVSFCKIKIMDADIARRKKNWN